ncbi:MAG: hypothetical protein IJA10_14630 [Lachnospiraceae bacterium]|nr:hypothetical protein [Lachnospiraceae bacterium]
MKKTNKNLRKKLFVVGLSVSMLLSTAGLCFAASDKGSYTYPRTGYTMEYTIATTKLAGKSAGCATTTVTSEETDAITFVGLFSYKNGNCKNSGCKQNITYTYLAIKGEGGNLYRSFHALKDMDYDPMGTNMDLEVK